jgi:hypothetical protein
LPWPGFEIAELAAGESRQDFCGHSMHEGGPAEQSGDVFESDMTT